MHVNSGPVLIPKGSDESALSAPGEPVGTADSGMHDRLESAPCAPQLVRQQAAIAPEALAVRAGSDSLTYRELDQRSNQLAQYLSGAGVLPGAVVGLCVERSVDFVVAALAIFKTGCAYLPLDTRVPRERLAMMLDDAEVPVVVTHSGVSASLAAETREVIPIDQRAAEISRCSSDPLPVCVTPEDLAYVIYTSGSTGKPKGVQVGHDSLLNLLRWHCWSFGVRPVDRATQLASVGFDAAVWEIWPYLVSGASVHLVDDETCTQPAKLRDWMVQERITIGFVPTPLAERMVKLTWPVETALRFLLTGADTMHQYPPAGLPFALVNNYGPTECTVVATSGPVVPQEAPDSIPSIGRPIDNCEVYILDHDMKQLPAGKIGEIFIGGAGLARGYRNSPGATAERFVENPFHAAPGARLYRTGDLGCYLPDGQIAFHGRVDDQVKILGYRIALGEVVSILDQHSLVEEVAVVVQGDLPDDKHLVAYVVPASKAVLTDSVLREFLRQHLPEYMHPSIFVRVDSLPLSPNGKVDRASLPAPQGDNIIRDEVWVAPGTATEKKLAAILSPLLHRKEIGVNDNFFLLGGNSLLGTQFINRVSAGFGVDLSLRALFDHPTIAGISREVDKLLLLDPPESGNHQESQSQTY
jgi:amino acid adenylation domain-containing protein